MKYVSYTFITFYITLVLGVSGFAIHLAARGDNNPTYIRRWIASLHHDVTTPPAEQLPNSPISHVSKAITTHVYRSGGGTAASSSPQTGGGASNGPAATTTATSTGNGTGSATTTTVTSTPPKPSATSTLPNPSGTSTPPSQATSTPSSATSTLHRRPR